MTTSINLKQLAGRIEKLPKKDHEPIYCILKKNNVDITVSDSSVLFLATSCSPDVLMEIDKIVSKCYDNLNNEKKYVQEYKSIENEIVRKNIESDQAPNVDVFRRNEVVEMNYYNRTKLDKMKQQDQERQRKKKPVRKTIVNVTEHTT